MVLENGCSRLMYSAGLLAQVLLVAAQCPEIPPTDAVPPPALCLPCRVPEVDLCIYDLSGCGYLPSGAICKVQCKEPYQGEATFAKCAANNTVEGFLLDWTPPNCSFSECPYPQTLPEGYVRDAAGTVYCAPGYEGTPTRRCSLVGPQCSLQSEVEGCRRLESCELLEDQECPRLDYQKCAELSPGQSCRVNCLAPFEGPGLEVLCPADNTEPNREPLRLSEPNCSLPCPVPEPIPYGYTNRSGEWRCEEGYSGEAKLICVYDGLPFCQRRVELRGCYRLMPCADLQLPPEADECELNLTDCQGVAPGGRCQVSCLTPFVDGGVPQFARCPAENMNPYLEPIYSQLPRCLLSCPDPPMLPEGYKQEITFSGLSVFRCDDGWVGQVNRSCIHFPNCSFQVRFEGCKRKVPCLPLEVNEEDSCRMDVSACTAVVPGESCRIFCREPYEGLEGTAHCPEDNVDPMRPLLPQMPQCRASCDDLPVGYMRTSEGWRCAEGFGGVASVTRADCGAPLEMRGCSVLQPCAVPQVDPCEMDLSDCDFVPPGGRCVVRCPEGVYEPAFAYATCPEGNTDPTHLVSFELTCVPKCTEPDPFPVEIAKDPEGNWACAEGYVGNVSEECIIKADPLLNCSGILNLTGCWELVPYAPLVLEDPNYAAQSCASRLEPGESCRISCRDGLHGDSSFAQCSENNVDPSAPPVLREWPDCRLECDSTPLGYEKTQNGWQCSPGYAGIPQASCRPSSRCGAELHLEGCNPIVPCLRPTFGDDVCRFVADCPDRLQPGGSCMVRCQLPYEGEATTAQCPHDNMRPTGEAIWARPNCSFHVCPDPAVFSVNYTKDAGSPVGWRCSDAMTGRAQKRCEAAPSVAAFDPLWPQCRVQEGFLSGCGVPQPCVPMEASEMWDECRFDISHCGEMVPNSFCEVRCRAPYVGDSTYARCATFNTDPNTPVEWTPPTCVMVCPVPQPIPDGYVLTGDQWTCATGYIGRARTRCQLGNGTCDAVQVLSGCDRLEPCIRPPEAACSLNFSACPDPLGQGEDCLVTCKQSYAGFLRPREEEDDMEEMANQSNFSNFSNFSSLRNIIPGRVMDLPDFVCVFQDCIDPEPIPLGYEKNEFNDTEEWSCSRGFAGNASSECRLREDCVGEVLLSECIPVSFCSLGELDACLMDASGCSERLEPGGSCELRCPEPTQGTSGSASCPQLNTEAGAPAMIQPPSCESPCDYLENVEAPFNFVSLAPLNLTGWACAEGYGGNKSITCHIDRDRDCNASYVFEGCKPLTKCAGLENIDPCRYIHSCIPGLLPGDRCEIRCLPPQFLGDPVVVQCSTENTDSSKPPQFAAWPSCAPQCEEPEVAPTGYHLNRSADVEWTCAEGYLGSAVPFCGPDYQCILRFSLSGCVPKVPCVAPSVPAGCLYDGSGCPSEILPGESCEIQCKSPYVGNATSASCDADNTVVNAASIYELPECLLDCGEVPVDLTEAYVRTQNGDWEYNSSGYLGTPVTLCELEDGCTAVLRISGCLPMVSCLSPDPRAFDVCQYNFQGCDSLAPGSSCNVSCQPPYIGGMTTATCPDLNLDPLAPIQYQQPNCTLLCPEPSPVPPGYLRGQESWLCADGYVGTAVASCLVDRYFSDSQGVCITRTELTGCVPVQPCRFPPSDVCDYDTSNCSSVPAGGTCQVSCRVPFSGTPSRGSCPADNTNRVTLVTVDMPTCTLDCPIPASLPEGYNISFTAQRSDGLAASFFATDPISGRRARVESRGYFECDESFAGDLTVTCTVDPDCDWRIEFANCRPTVPCAPLELNVPPCGLIAPDCDVVSSGRSCMATCQAPCTGQSAELYCPIGNTDPDQPLMGQMPNCITECDFVPAGYRRSRDAENGWECAHGYTGSAEVFCLPSGPGRVCETEILLQGCVEMVPCGPGNFDPCQYDMSDCMSVPRGESCTIRCNSVYTGMDFNATCPIENTQVNDGLQFEDGNCLIRECPEPNLTNESVFPWEYVDDDAAGPTALIVQCRVGFAGQPRRVCTAVGSTCQAEADYLGCTPIVACGPPDLDFCRHEDVCTSVPAGGACRIPCKFPFFGPAINTSCPDNNTDADEVPSLGPDLCQIGCEDPDQPPTGYAKVNGTWSCASGWGGQAVPVCVLNETDIFNGSCGSFMNLSGCFPLQPCVRPSTLDSCTYQVDYALSPGVTSPVRCRYPPFNPEDMVEAGLRCPGDNIQADREAEILQLPSCEMFCPSPPPPAGYVKSHDLLSFGENETGVEINRAPAYSCADGWTGTANHSCMIDRSNGKCSIPVTFQGCFQLVPCKPIDPRSFDVCTYNITECMERSQDTVGPYTGPMGGTSCELSCRDPMLGDVTTASCEDLNINPNRRMEYQLPTCSMYCPKPTTLPDGYEHLGTTDLANPSNEYRCASGYGGTASISCYLRGAYSSVTETVQCSTITDFEGCLPLRSCRAPEVDSCRHDVWACRSLQAGQTCEVTCAPPLEGSPATFECPADNVVPQQVVLGELPACRFPFGCEEPFPLTEGYVKINETSYTCDEGFIGEAQWDCYLERLCSPVLVLSGCHKLVPCMIPAPEDQLCGLDYDVCANLMGGQNCEVPCLPGFIFSNATEEMSNVTQVEPTPQGNISHRAMVFTCPVENIDPNQVIIYDAPRCIFEACVDPDPTPEGYAKIDGNWSCAEGFVGEVYEDCNTCNASLTLSGCLKRVACLTPRVPEQCMFDLSNCTNLAPGDLCEIQCRAPYQGASTFGECPSDNTDTDYDINITEPHCSLVCPWPQSIPPGYAWTTDGWQCSNGYHGMAELECPISADCSVTSQLSGCTEPQSCTAPSFERCQHVEVAKECADLPPSQACNLTCAPPFLGEATMAECPYDNPNASHTSSFLAPRCVHPSCPEVVPPGYQKTLRGWSCARGYAGEALQSCTSDQDCCSLRLRLEGCRPIRGCKLPQLSEMDECKLDLSDCINISSGKECEVRCRAPFFGVPSVASCVADNTDPEKILDWSLPFCQILRCDRPMPPPPGYIYNGLAELCAPGYAGSAMGTCRGGRSENDCVAPPMELTGCQAVVPCPLSVQLNSCMMRSTCTNGTTVESNSSCEIQCTAPYSGTTTFASCPAENVDPERNASVTLPSCVLQCDPPSVIPSGYEMTENGWSCSEGFIGAAVGICVLDEASCTSSLQLSGCKKLQPCLAPGPPNPCMYDLSACRDVQPGSFCRLFCKAPYTGGAPKLICPAGNTDPNYIMKWVEPYCFCSNPEQVPLGYSDDGQGGFRCSPGFVGAPQLRCQAARFECLQKSEIYGCVNPDVCHLLPFFDDNESPGVITGQVSFGPAMVAGRIDEEQVEGYDVFFADECNEVVGSLVASVDRTFLPAVGGCCEVMHYMVQLRDVWIPDGAVKLMVAIRGLNTGKVVNFTDSSGGPVQQRPGTSTSIRKAATGAAPGTVPWRTTAVLLALQWLMAMGM